MVLLNYEIKLDSFFVRARAHGDRDLEALEFSQWTQYREQRERFD